MPLPQETDKKRGNLPKIGREGIKIVVGIDKFKEIFNEKQINFV